MRGVLTAKGPKKPLVQCNQLTVARSCSQIGPLADEQADSYTREPPATLLSGTAFLKPCRCSKLSILNAFDMCYDMSIIWKIPAYKNGRSLDFNGVSHDHYHDV